MERETIAAISTGMTNSGIGIVRISGEEAFPAADRIFRGREKVSDVKSHTIHYGHIYDGEEEIDQVLVMAMRAPHTYTGEDTIEINCHGGTFVVRRVLETVLKNGVRPAEPGEFTKRAFLNGKMDLSQAEAVSDLITSRNEYARKSSISQLKGSVKNRINDIRNEIIYHTAFIESALDDPEHISVDGYGDTLKTAAEKIVSELDRLILSSDDGRIMREGIQTVILGKPNAGKSSLLNVLMGYDRAIVTEIAGTTRDALEEQIHLKGLSLNIIDTAGIRQTEDIVEKMGVDKAKDYARNADLVIYVVDASEELDEDDDKILDLIRDKKVIILLNKSDLKTVVDVDKMRERIRTVWINDKNADLSEIPVIEISAKEEQGISELEKTVEKMFLKGSISFNDEVYITNARQKSALTDARESMKKVIGSIENGMPEDFYSIDLMDAYEALGRITGDSVGEDLINEIFSKFCMGK
ncbi:tRNA uridine-5-carboxymethylaminomethyl(34) synthesis GTPase MnmE [Lachnoclostridium sp. An169]|uniref:tRNA uridine-5-carboxymethylaminomethyl(34) synthesis GTPase MnmE n=1 Tax=Lachnoclostridium sp. An169 TaxID=1965569 RepID=UPI000B3923CC|nr:tRNA uridine-5-carboxymethylaminomethyl(34) synthesis GTPase MnmE [Lachnoclostridium sp. An169]OUP81993.1 tRNA uridine-5-carboxymethylaminomethyl(34) synthesis GTPase MnmE [Lachnoclostridium sp. An169]